VRVITNCCFVSDIRFQVLIAVAMNLGIVFSGIGRHVVYITNVSKKNTVSIFRVEQ
jgi:hypothetical protein